MTTPKSNKEMPPEECRAVSTPAPDPFENGWECGASGSTNSEGQSTARDGNDDLMVG